MDRLTRGARTSSAAAVAVLLLGANVMMPAAAVAIDKPGVDPAALPPDDTPGPDQEMKQENTCADPLTVATPDVTQPAPGNVMLDITKAWKYSTGAGVTVGLIDTGVTPNPRLPRCFAGGDYVMGDENGGLFDCDSHGTVVASIIAAQPSDPGAKPPPMPPGIGAAPPPPGVPASPFPTTPPPAPPKPSTVTVTQPAPPPPPPPPQDEPPPDEGVAPAAGPGDGEYPPVPGPPPGSPDGVVGVAPDAALISVRQSSSAFGPSRPASGDNDEMRRKAGDIATLARAVVHLANLGVKVMNISVTACINAAQPIDQAALGAAIRYAAVDKDIVIVSAAGTRARRARCGQNPVFNPLRARRPARLARRLHDRHARLVLRLRADGRRGGPRRPAAAAEHRRPLGGVAAARVADHGPVERQRRTDQRAARPRPGQGNPVVRHQLRHRIHLGGGRVGPGEYPNLSAHQVIRRITETAHNPPRGVDNKVGYGVVDPVAALTFDVPSGDRLPPENLTSLLHVPAPPPPPDLRPRNTALIGAGVVAAFAVAVVAGAAVRRRRT